MLFFPGNNSNFQPNEEEMEKFASAQELIGQVAGATGGDYSTAEIVVNELIQDYDDSNQDSVDTSYSGNR